MHPDSLPPRLRNKIVISPESDCWLWIAAKDKHGYGRVNWDGKIRFGHRVVFALLSGDPGDELDHLCRNPSCVFPGHLEPVTHKENTRRGLGGKGQRERWPIGRLCPQGHVIAGDNLYSHYSAKWGRTNTQCRRCKSDANKRRVRRAKA